jgi:hypothetical protein
LTLKPKSDYTWGKLFAMTATESQQPGKLTPTIWPPQESYFEDKQIINLDKSIFDISKRERERNIID